MKRSDPVRGEDECCSGNSLCEGLERKEKMVLLVFLLNSVQHAEERGQDGET